MRILFLTTMLPGEKLTGSEVVSDRFVHALRSHGHDVTVLGYRRRGRRPPVAAGDIPVGERQIETDEGRAWPLVWMARAMATGEAYSATKYVSARYRRLINRELGRGPAMVVVDHAQMGWAVPETGWTSAWVYLAHNVEHDHYRRLAAGGGWRTRVYAREHATILPMERKLCRKAGQVWALTADDAARLERLGARDARVFDVPPSAAPPLPGPAECDVAMLGSWSWEANAAGLRWFVEHVLPHLPPTLDVHVGGASASAVVGERENVTVRGRVPDAVRFLQTAKVIAVPSVTGSGVQVKTLDAIASGRRVVATPTAMRGISGVPRTVRVEGEPQAFADAILAGVQEPADADAAGEGRAWAQRREGCFVEAVQRAVGDLGFAGR